jgi:hypothetical protein
MEIIAMKEICGTTLTRDRAAGLKGVLARLLSALDEHVELLKGLIRLASLFVQVDQLDPNRPLDGDALHVGKDLAEVIDRCIRPALPKQVGGGDDGGNA